MRHRERGVTFLGWMFLLLPMALVVYAGIRLTPIYLEYMKIARTLEQVADDFKGDQADSQRLRMAIERRFDIEDVHVISATDAAAVVIRKQGSGFTVQATYEDTAPFISNILLLVEFDKVVKVEQ